MLKFSNYKESIANRLSAIKKTNLKDDKAIQDSLEIILSVVDHINGLEPEEIMIMGRPIDKFYLPQGLSCFINPKKVRVDTSFEACNDLLHREYVIAGKRYKKDGEERIDKYSYADFLNACDTLWQIITRNSYSKTTLEEIRNDASLNDVVARSYDATARKVLPFGDKPYLPIEITVHGVINDSRRYVDIDDMVNDWILLELENIF